MNKLDSIIEAITQAIIKMEGGDKPKSINQTMIQRFGKYNPGHLIWAGQRLASPVSVGDREWAGWNTYEEGVHGIRNDVRAKINRGDTLTALISAYAPPTENNTKNYIDFVSKNSNIPADVALKVLAAESNVLVDAKPTLEQRVDKLEGLVSLLINRDAE